MKDNLLTAGEFAKLARTTKRTVLWYAEKGILIPYKIDESGYRLYRPEQIIDFQSISLMRQLGFSLTDIKRYVEQGYSLAQLFGLQRKALEKQVSELKVMLATTNQYYSNIAASGTLVKPKTIYQSSDNIYYLEKEGSYSSIKTYLIELQSLMQKIPVKAKYITIFENRGYSPKKAKMKIGILSQEGVVFKNGIQLPQYKIPSYTALCHSTYGSGALLSLLWQELDKFRIINDLIVDLNLPFAGLEIYNDISQINADEDTLCTTDLHLPINE